MARFERSRNGNRDFKDNFSKGKPKGRRGSRGNYSKGCSRGGRDSGRGRRDSGRGRRDVEMTKVTCSSCGSKCEVPFKPTSTKPVYCDDCFSKKDKGSSSKDLEVINEKLDKIMKALKIK